FQALVLESYLRKPMNGDIIGGTNRAINFIICVFKSAIGNVLQTLESCSKKINPDNYKTFLDHINHNSDDVKKAFKAMNTKTNKVIQNGTLPRLPFVTINGHANYDALDD